MGEARGKNLVVCCDGTWNDADSGRAETNVAVMARAVRAGSGGLAQITLYLRGVGSTGFALQRLVDGATGSGIDENIRSAYQFLCQNYEPGDRLYLFGFSRGAFTARSLGGLIGACGLLKRWSLDRIPEAWRFYREAKQRDPDRFCADCADADTHRDVEIRFMGVWDTVGALGIPSSLLGGLTRGDYEFHDTTPSRRIRTARHALAIDEYRDQFVPTFWTAPNAAERVELAKRDIQQVWFAGAHADVGGGYRRRGLADHALVWMAAEAQKAGLQLDWERILPAEGTLDPLAPQHDPRQSWSTPDKITPTWRRVMERDIEVPAWQTLFVPLDSRKRPLLTINEAIHPSVRQRFGQRVATLAGNETGRERTAPYRPRNAEPALRADAP